MKLNLKNKFLLIRTKLFIYLWTRRLNKSSLLRQCNIFYRTKILSWVCLFKEHLWETKVEWTGPKTGKYRTCSRCLKAEKYETIFSTKVIK